ncbi:MAG: succinate dehydrogenase iron-sulfur subunit [Candidatus Nitrosocaldaceae archaeon]|nr:MAG: succinate dehydrogenase iron-sulfur subunit [Candidatus Nitrosocaldaceae archaeon]
MNKIKLRVMRYNNGKKHYDTFEVPYQRWTTVLDALLHVKAYQDHSLALRYSCRMASCGSCGMMINGVPRLACYTKIDELEGDEITCEPLVNFPIIRDLATNFERFFAHHKRMMPYIINENVDRKMDDQTREFLQTPKEVEEYLQFSYCIKCGLCYAACPTTATDKEFPGPQALAQMYRYFIDSRDQASKKRLEIIDNRHGIWRCHFAGSCSTVCPKGVDPALGIQLLRGYMLGFSKKVEIKPKLYRPSSH